MTFQNVQLNYADIIFEPTRSYQRRINGSAERTQYSEVILKNSRQDTSAMSTRLAHIRQEQECQDSREMKTGTTPTSPSNCQDLCQASGTSNQKFVQSSCEAGLAAAFSDVQSPCKAEAISRPSSVCKGPRNVDAISTEQSTYGEPCGKEQTTTCLPPSPCKGPCKAEPTTQEIP